MMFTCIVHHQGLGQMKPMEEMLMMMAVGTTNPSQDRPKPPPAPPLALEAADALNPAAAAGAAARTERPAPPPQKEKALHCPRCSSTNTKFCYYNHFSLQTPRYWCKTCRRYWTEGGSLRNVPVGGGSRKNKRRSSSAPPSAAAAAAAATSAAVSSGSGTVVVPVGFGGKNTKLMPDEGAHDLKPALPHRHGLQPPEFAAFPSLEGNGVFSAMELLRSAGVYVPLQDVQLGMRPTEYASAGFVALGEFRMPTPPPPPPPFLSQSVLGLSVDTHGTEGYSSTGWQGVQENAAGRLLFPFDDLRPAVPVSAGGATNPRDDLISTSMTKTKEAAPSSPHRWPEDYTVMEQ